MAEPKDLNDRRRDDRGFSLIELVMAMAILGLVLAAAAPVMIGALNLSRNNRNRSIAAGLANQQIDSVRDIASSNFAALVAGNTTATQVVDGTTYTVTQFNEYVPPNGTLVLTSSCSGSATGPNLLRVSVLVTWPNMAGVTPVQNQTILAPPAGSFDPYLGAIGVMVLDRNGKPEVGISVSVNTTPVSVLPTSNDGCAYFPNITPNTVGFPTYTITLSQAGFVDRQFDFSANASAAVTAGDARQVIMDYDNSAQIQATLVGASAGNVPVGVPITLFNSKFLPAGKAFPAGSGSPRTVTALFPDPAGFKMWAGDCADADPEGHQPPASPPGPLYYPAPAARPPAVAVTPGGSSPTTLTLASVDVKVTHVLLPAPGTPVAGATITAIHAPDTNSCTAGDSLVLVPTTDATGTLRVSLPYGTWSLKASLGVLNATSASFIVAPSTSGSVPVVTVGIIP